MNSWRQHEAGTVNAEPGVQVYEDPDAQASPLDPAYEAGLSQQPVLYPIPAAYAGTCGSLPEAARWRARRRARPARTAPGRSASRPAAEPDRRLNGARVG